MKKLRDVAVLTQRNLMHIKREPLQLSDVTVQPVLFTLLFVYVFGSGVVLPGGGSYKDFAIAGLLAMNLTTSSMGTAVGLSSDLGSGVIDRFRTLAMWRPAVLVGRSLADLLTAVICAFFVAATGLLIGWRPDAGVASIAAGFGIFLLFSYGLSWGCACLGMVSKSPESAQGIGLVILFPLASARRLESRQRCHRRLAPAPRQPQSLGEHPRLADATSGARVAAVVAGADRGVRAAGQLAVQASHHRLSACAASPRDERLTCSRPMRLRALTPADWPRVLALNAASVQELSELDERRLRWILSLAHRSLAVEGDGEVVAFALAIASGTDYDSENYRWFAARFERFVYLDRIAVAASQRRLGLGAQLYDAIEAAAASFERMVCEVNVRPPNPASLAFHSARGYVEVGRLAHGSTKLVAMLEKEL